MVLLNVVKHAVNSAKMFIDYSLYNVGGKEPDWVPEFKRCRKWLEDALEYADGTFNIIDVADGIFKGSMQLWPFERAVAVSQIITYPRKKVLHAFLMGGEMDDVKKIERAAVVWAKSQNCHAITLTGRPGWSKSFLKEVGYESAHISMTKEI